MKDFYADYIQDERWLIKETEWAKELQNKRESQFALGNGYLGARGILADMPVGAIPGLYIAGLYDKMGSQVDELVNLPNPINFKFTIEGHKLDAIAMDVASHNRTLNMKKAILVQRTLYRDRKKRQFDYQSLRFMSMKDKNIGVMQIILTSLDEDCSADINTGIDTSVSNIPRLSEGYKKHFRVRELGQEDNAGYLAIETLQKKHIVVFRSGFYYEVEGKKVFAKDNVFKIHLKKNHPIIFTKLFFIKHFPYKQDIANIKTQTRKAFRKVFHEDFTRLLAEHMRLWERAWKRADVLVKGTANIQQNLRFNIYHMLICGWRDNGFSSIAARTLSGEGYRGHVFWDAEIFVFPFFLFNFPDIAKNMLMYRYRRLNKSRALAQEEGFKGAKFAWESARNGEEETPEWSTDINGKIIPIHTQQMEHHITADVAYAFYKYFVVTKDEKFMEDYGYEVLFETARFWASRVKFNKKRAKYEIPNIIGPDEFHINVKNNAYTNMIARWNLITAYNLFNKLKKNTHLFKHLKEKLALENKEAIDWKRISQRLKLRIAKSGLIEQFDGYFKLKKVIFDKFDENGLPIIPKDWGSEDFSKTQLIKQPDVLMLLYLLGEDFNDKTKIANYKFYINKVTHNSSLSPSVSALNACEAYDLPKAYSLFNVALHIDISNIFGNSHEGVHAASLGGTWQTVIFGFGGVKIMKDKLSITPRMPLSWHTLEFCLFWQGNILNLKLTNDCVKIKNVSQKKKILEIYIFGRKTTISPGKWFSFIRRTPIGKKQYYY
ncbi:MAG: glycoside hydrolase family 65 protein [Candidatus Omnitrophota bacterium]|nr:MAG: glycoside hydrolase family 65 protein [Candidatus Omnitrophota bacterium]